MPVLARAVAEEDGAEERVDADEDAAREDQRLHVDVGARDTGAPVDTGAADTGVVDAGQADTGAVDTGTVVDAMPADLGADAGPAMTWAKRQTRVPSPTAAPGSTSAEGWMNGGTAAG